jgi:hypothetical protein
MGRSGLGSSDLEDSGVENSDLALPEGFFAKRRSMKEGKG